MLVYIAVFLLVLALGFYVSERKKTASLQSKKSDSHLFVFLILLIFIGVTGFRGVGADFNNYVRLYNNQKNSSFADLWESIITFKDPGYRLICIISKWIYDSPITMFMIFVVLTIVPIIIVMYKETDNFAFSIVLYTLLVWVDSFGAIRQAVASAFIVLGLPYLKKQKFCKYCLCVIAATMFHVTALVMLPVYFVLTRRMSFKNTLLIIVVSVVLRYSYDFIFEILNVYKGKDITEYSYMTSDVNIFRVLVSFAPILLFFFVPKNKMKRTEVGGNSLRLIDISMNIVLVNAALMFATMSSTYLARVSIYLVAFFPITIPEIIKVYDKKSYGFIVAIMTVLYFLYWLYGIHAQGLEYMTIFQR